MLGERRNVRVDFGESQYFSQGGAVLSFLDAKYAHQRAKVLTTSLAYVSYEVTVVGYDELSGFIVLTFQSQIFNIAGTVRCQRNKVLTG